MLKKHLTYYCSFKADFSMAINEIFPFSFLPPIKYNA